MALNRITADSITDGTVIASDIANGTITLNKFASGVLPSEHANAAFAQANTAYLPSATRLDVTHSGSAAFLLDQYSGNNPQIYVKAGETISFNLNVTGHPFMIRLSAGGANYDTGLTHVSTTGVVTTGSAAQGKVTGVLYFKVPFTLAGSTYVYQCSIHGGMVGNIVFEQPTDIIFNAANAATATDTTQNNSITVALNTSNAAFTTANSAASTGKAIAMSIVFGG
jgi:plastocyanin